MLIDWIELVEDIEYVDKLIICGNKVFVLIVKGDSMIGDMIMSGDIVICLL